MRTETITREIFTFDELSEDAQRNAISDYRENGIDTQCYWDEAHRSVKGFHAMFGSEEGHRSWLDVRTGRIDDDILNLSGQRLRTYLINNFEEAFYERKFRGHSKNDHRQVESCCPFTGVCYDEDLLQPFKEFIKAPDNRTFDDLLTEAVETLRISLENEDDYNHSDEAIKEIIEANGYEFTEDGDLI